MKYAVLVCSISLWLLLPGLLSAASPEPAAQSLPLLSPSGMPSRTPLAGEGFRGEVFGREVAVQPRSRRSVWALDLGASLFVPAPEHSPVDAYGLLSIWEHPDNDRLFYGYAAVVYNELFLARKLPGSGSFEWVAALHNYTVPASQAELVDGEALKSQELTWGYIFPGIGVGWRKQVAPGYQDNMLAADLLFEPGYLYFNRGSETAAAFVVPEDTPDLRFHLEVRLDRIERNLLELPHRGCSAGADLIYGRRSSWSAWGLDGSETRGRFYESASAYFLAAGGVPGVPGDRHRLIGALFAGTGRNLDRFSAPRIGGGVNPIGEEYGSSSRPVLPGSAYQEFFPRHYLLLTGEYRWEAFFFAYLGFDATVGALDRLRLSPGGGLTRKTDTFTSLGGRITSGFLFNSRIQIAYNYNFNVVRQGSPGGHEIIVNIGREL